MDGLRGILAIWVFVGHMAHSTGYGPWFIPAGAIAVDIFMLLSGLLMTANFFSRGGLDARGICRFWARRFFRIAPLYFLLLAVALVLWTQYREMTLTLQGAYPPPWADRLHLDPSQPAPTPANIAAHLSFTFGLFPQFASNNPLPDWSLSLEMQFYVALPFLLLAVLRLGVVPVWFACVVIGVWTRTNVGLYLSPSELGLWPQPAMLAFKIDTFMVGVLIAHFAVKRQITSIVLIAITALLHHSWIFAAAAFLCLLIQSESNGVTELARRLLSMRAARFLGDISYAVYLCHMLVLLPVVVALTGIDQFQELRASQRFLVALTICSAIVFPLSVALHYFIEKPGIAVGQRLTRKAGTLGA